MSDSNFNFDDDRNELERLATQVGRYKLSLNGWMASAYSRRFLAQDLRGEVGFTESSLEDHQRLLSLEFAAACLEASPADRARHREHILDVLDLVHHDARVYMLTATAFGDAERREFFLGLIRSQWQRRTQAAQA